MKAGGISRLGHGVCLAPRVVAALLVGTFGLLAGIAPALAQTCPAGLDRVTPDADFIDNADGTVVHLRTGLMWKQCVEGASGASCSGDPTLATWSEAFDAAANANVIRYAGYGDWRVPNLKEALSIRETGCHSPGINTVRFPNPPATIWTGTSSVRDPTLAWVADFQGAAIANISKELGKTGPLPVRLVRDGRAYAAFDALPGGCTLDADGNGAVDALTDGLLLMRAMLGLTGTAATTGATGPNAARTAWADVRKMLIANCGLQVNP
jgi:hypothetical protein